MEKFNEKILNDFGSKIFKEIQELNNKKNIFISLLKDGGVTVKNGNIVTYEEGFQVCFVDSEEKNITELSSTSLDNLFELFLCTISDLKDYGAWLDDDRLVIDTHSIHLNDFEDACLIGVLSNQKAIYDWKNKESFYLD